MPRRRSARVVGGPLAKDLEGVGLEQLEQLVELVGVRRRELAFRMHVPSHNAGVLELNAQELDELAAFLVERRRELELDKGARVMVREVERAGGGGCFRLELVRCGKERCRCSTGAKLHGPYWYVYTPGGGRGGKPSHRYIGKPGSEAASIAGLD